MNVSFGLLSLICDLKLFLLVYALNYFEKVEETFKSANKLYEFEQFEEILRRFDISIQPVSSLYKVS